MIGQLRRARILALLLLLAMPGLGGAWLQAVHPCATAAPWTAQHSGDHHHAGTPASQPDSPEQRHHGDCHCVGACHAGLGWAFIAAPQTFAEALVIDREPSAPTIPSAAPASRPDRLLPPATAPPTA